ncbi:MAG: replicative DNA helicase [Xenococcus sp. MO_188.B8]|nr:replicative DNA helicase [Xenococcus sp. MO_188.B8]
MVDISDSIPPVNIEAEEAILGGILLDPEAMARVADTLVKEAFSLQAHQEIYHAAQVLHIQGKPTDLMAVSTYLADRGLLDKVGGTTKLGQLLNRTVSAVNIDRYNSLVMEKYSRRQLIKAGHEIVDLGYETAKELEIVLDESEQKIFRLTQERPQQGLVAIAETLVNAFNTIEDLHQETVLPGIPSGFYDLDGITSGFGRSDLIIIAGRPAMGKCLAANSELVCADGSIATIEEIYHRRTNSLLTLQDNWKFAWTKPSAYVDDGTKPVFRMTTRLGRSIETTLTHPYLTIQGWKSLGQLKVGDKIAVPRQINSFGQQTISEGQVKILAYLIGDGTLTKNSPLFTNSNTRLLDDFSDSVVSSFMGLSCQMETSKVTRTPSIRVSKDQLFIEHNRRIFAQNLKQARQNQNRTAYQIADLLEVSPSLITLWTQGNCLPNQTTFDKLCNLLGVQPQDLAPSGILAICNKSSNALTLWLQELGLWGKNAYNKIIPELVFTWQRPLVSLFLNRLFATNGWATVLNSGQSQIGYGTVSEKLARQIQHLLLRFGIIASLNSCFVKDKNNRQDTWQLEITDDKSIKNFITEIGIFGKEEAVNAVQKTILQKKYHTNRDLIPVEVGQKFEAAKGQDPWVFLAKHSGIKGDRNIDFVQGALSRERLFKLACALENDHLQNLATSDVYWDEIVAIESVGNKQVYDLTIPETHNFVANDICVHNTSFALNIAANIAKQQSLPTAIFSLEMSREQLAQRMLASEAKIPSNRLRSGRISQNEYEPLINAVTSLSELPIFIDDTANLSVMQMRSQVRRLQGQTKQELGLVLLDYLQLMEGSGSDNRVQELSKITRSLKQLAREINSPIIALSQLSRGVEQRTNKRPMLSDLRESGSIEQDADLVMMLYRDEYYNPDTPDRGIAEAIIVKHRNGPVGTVKLLFKGELTKFENLAKPGEY